MATTKRVPVPGHIKTELAALTPDQLEAVAKLAASMAGGKYVPKDKVTKVDSGGRYARAEALYDALAVELYRKRRLESKPFQLLLSRQDAMAKTLLEKQQELDRFLDAACQSRPLTEAERFKLYAFSANLVAGALVKAELSMSMNTLINWLGQAPNHYDQQFPGYVRAGLLHSIVGAVLQQPVGGQSGSVVDVRREPKDRKKQTAQDLRARYRHRYQSDKKQ